MKPYELILCKRNFTFYAVFSTYQTLSEFRIMSKPFKFKLQSVVEWLERLLLKR